MVNKNKILIVEDEISLLDVLHRKFINEGFNVLVARDGHEGLTLALKEKPNMILLDIVMPKMDGLTMLSNLRKNKWGQEAKVILLTNLMDPEKMSQALKDNVSAYLVKSDWKLEDLVTEVKSRLV